MMLNKSCSWNRVWNSTLTNGWHEPLKTFLNNQISMVTRGYLRYIFRFVCNNFFQCEHSFVMLQIGRVLPGKLPIIHVSQVAASSSPLVCCVWLITWMFYYQVEFSGRPTRSAFWHISHGFNDSVSGIINSVDIISIWCIGPCNPLVM